MAIEDGNQVLPTGAFEGFTDDDDNSEALSSLSNDDDDDGDTSADVITDTIEKGLEDTTDAAEDTAENTAENTAEDTADDNVDTADDNVDTADTEDDTEDTAEDTADDTAEEDFIPNVEEEGEAPLAPGETPKILTKKEKFDRYSRSVQRRINKGTKQREELREENRVLHERIANIETSMQQTQVNNEAAVLDNRLRNATAIKQQLLEEGEYARAAEVDNDIIEMRISKNNINAQQEQRAQQAPNGYPAGQQPAQQGYAPNGAPSTVPQDNVPSAQTQWIQNNQRFGREPGYTSYVNENYDAMIAQGYNSEDPNMYVELDRRIGRAPAQAAPAQVAPAQVAPTVKPRAQAAPAPNTGQQAQTHAKAKGLTEADKLNMAGWGLDPKNVAHRKEF
ncbi:MAG: hypothetical protein DRQ35_06280, partial [Gammaproteobacteria bacterium]